MSEEKKLREKILDVKNLDISMKTKAEITNDAFLLLFDKPIKNTILHETLVKGLDGIQFLASIASRATNAMQKQ